MPDPQTTNKQLYTPAHGADVDSWDVPVNFNWNQLDAALGRYTTLNANGLSGTIALTTSMTAPLGFIVTGTPAGTINYQTPAGIGGLWLVRNQATLGASITLGFSSASGGSTVNIPSGTNIAVSADGTANGMVDIDTGTGAAGGSNTQIQVNVLGALGAYAGFTFNGTTFHTPEITVDGNAIFGTGAGSTMTINGTAISVPNGFNFNTGAFQMNAGGMLGIGTAPTVALVTVGGQIASTSGGYVFPDSTTSQTANGKVLQLSTVAVNSATSAATFAGTYGLSGTAPTTSGGVHVTPFDSTFTPKSASSTLEIEVILKGVVSDTAALTVALFNNTTLIDYGVETLLGATPNGIQTFTLKTWFTPGATTAIPLKVYVGTTSGAAFHLNSYGNADGFPQPSMISWLSVKEIQPGGP